MKMYTDKILISSLTLMQLTLLFTFVLKQIWKCTYIFLLLSKIPLSLATYTT